MTRQEDDLINQLNYLKDIIRQLRSGETYHHLSLDEKKTKEAEIDIEIDCIQNELNSIREAS